MDVAFQQMDRTLPAVDHTDRDGDPAIRILIVNGHELMNPHEILVHFIATQFMTLDPLETSTLIQKYASKRCWYGKGKKNTSKDTLNQATLKISPFTKSTHHHHPTPRPPRLRSVRTAPFQPLRRRQDVAAVGTADVQKWPAAVVVAIRGDPMLQ